MTARNFDDFHPHSPMYKNRHVDEEARWKLFNDKPFIHGRWPKMIMAWAVSMLFWAGYLIHNKHKMAQLLATQTFWANRRMVPFIQAMEDVRYVAIQERNYMLLRALCDSACPENLEAYRNQYNQEDFHVPFFVPISLRVTPDGKPGSSRFFDFKQVRKAENEMGLVNSNEMSIYSSA